MDREVLCSVGIILVDCATGVGQAAPRTVPPLEIATQHHRLGRLSGPRRLQPQVIEQSPQACDALRDCDAMTGVGYRQVDSYAMAD